MMMLMMRNSIRKLVNNTTTSMKQQLVDRIPPARACMLVAARGKKDRQPKEEGRVRPGKRRQQQQEEEATAEASYSRKPKIHHHELFLNERDLFFSLCYISLQPQAGIKYYPTVKEKKAGYEDVYPQGIENWTAIYNSGASVRVQFDIDPTRPKDMHRISKFPKKAKFDRVFYLDITGEKNIMDFFIMCSRVLNDKGEIHIIIDTNHFDSLPLEDIAALKIFIKLDTEYYVTYCVGYTPRHVTIKNARILIFELDETRKTRESNKEELVSETPSSSTDNPLILESGRASEVNPSVGQVSMIRLVCDTDLGLLSQNVKAGGRNPVLSADLDGRLPYVIDRPNIIFGAHHDPVEDSSPALVVASMAWPQVTNCKFLVSSQPHQQESMDLYMPKRGVIHGGSVRELLFPCFEKVIGVSESQFREVQNEMVKIRKVAASMGWPQVVSAEPRQQEIMQDLHTPTRGVTHGGFIRQLLLPCFKKTFMDDRCTRSGSAGMHSATIGMPYACIDMPSCASVVHRAYCCADPAALLNTSRG